MDGLSFIIFFIYSVIILIIMVYISPVISTLVMMLIPVASVYLMPGQTISFFSTQQFLIAGVPIQNIHVLLLIWSALIAVAVYSEILSWYLLREEAPAPKKQVVTPVKTVSPVSENKQKSLKNKAEDFLLKLGKIMSGRKQ